MPNETPNADFVNDGSLMHAAMEMPDLPGLDDPNPTQTTEIIDPREANNRRRTAVDMEEEPQPQRQQQKRTPDGKYAEGFKPNLPPEADEIDDKAAPAAVEASGADDEWFELPPEKEGEAPRRIKAEEVWKGYQEREQLLQYIDQIQRITPPPPQYDEEIVRTAQTRHRLIQELEKVRALTQPMEPDLDLINENPGRYDPPTYQRQVAYARSQQENLQKLNARIEQEQTLLKQEQEALTAARKAREQGKLLQFWPELRDPAVQRQVRDDAARFFGITEDDFTSILDARFYCIPRYALAHVHGAQQRQQAVKVVRAKPKLVRGAARDQSGQKAQQYSSGMRKLASSGSIEDAADALGALI